MFTKAHFKHLYIRILLPPFQLGKERKISSTAIHITFIFASQPDPSSHLTQTFSFTQYPLSISERKLPPVQILQPALPCISRYPLKAPLTSTLPTIRDEQWHGKKRDSEVLLNSSNCLRKELGWEIVTNQGHHPRNKCEKRLKN